MCHSSASSRLCNCTYHFFCLVSRVSCGFCALRGPPSPPTHTYYSPEFTHWCHVQAWDCVQQWWAGVGSVTVLEGCCCSACFSLPPPMLSVLQLWSPRTSASLITKAPRGTVSRGSWQLSSSPSSTRSSLINFLEVSVKAIFLESNRSFGPES